MEKEQVDAMLKSYRFHVGRCGHLKAEISLLEKEIERRMKALPFDLSCPQSPQLSDMPHGTSLSNPTERIAILLASGWLPDDIQAMQAELAALREEYDRQYHAALFVSSWLKGLTERERWIVEHQVMDGEYWKDVVLKYRAAYAEDMSKDSLKRLKQRALDKIYQMAE